MYQKSWLKYTNRSRRNVSPLPELTCCKVQRLTVAYICSKQRKMQYNYNSKTRLQNNNRYTKAIVYSARQSNTINNAP
ncbi:hypothetical protein HBI41_202800 [Parastagonospora nodorum]|nr:hypothetical protein HBI41_202800 [Parastagonospora nodorum]